MDGFVIGCFVYGFLGKDFYVKGEEFFIINIELIF